MLATITLALFAVLLGAAFLLAGYRFFLVMLPIWGFFGGFWLGAYSVSLILGGGFLATTTGLVVGFVVGIIGAVLVAFSGMLLFGQITVAELQTGRNLIQPVFQGSWFWSIVWLVLTIVGVVVQIRTHQTYAFTKEMYVEGWPEALKNLKDSQDEELIGIQAAVALHKDEKGQIHFQDVGLTPAKGAAGGVVLGAVVGILTGGTGIALGALGALIGGLVGRKNRRRDIHE